MEVTVTGTVEYRDIELGVWVLATPSGETYELVDAPPQLLQNGLRVQIEGIVRNDMMTVSMVGPILEVRSFAIQ